MKSNDFEEGTLSQLEIAAAGMRAWDEYMKSGVRDWHTMLMGVFWAMKEVDPEYKALKEYKTMYEGLCK